MVEFSLDKIRGLMAEKGLKQMAFHLYNSI